MTDPFGAKREPTLANLPAGDYVWCGHPFTITTRSPGQSRTVWLCDCGHSRTKPFCDGSHNRLPPP